MKKNITINLFGQLYHIDEDAFELLDKYQKNMQSYFSRQEGGDEIADDIAHRVAEHFSELTQQGVSAITIEHVQHIIEQIGNPEDLGDTTDATDDSTTPPPSPTMGTAQKKLYRDGDDKMLGGVISGLCRYFGGNDSLPWRVLFLMACIFSYSGLFWVYLVMWALIPEAKTAEERLLMKGTPVNASTLNQEIMTGIRKARNEIIKPENRSAMRGCVTGLLNVLILLLKLLFVLLLVSCTVAALFFVIASAMTVIPSGDTFAGGPFGDIAEASKGLDGVKWLILATCICMLLVVAIPAFITIRGLFGRKNPETEGKKTSKTLWFAWAVILLAFFVLLPLSIVKSTQTLANYEDKRNTRDGITLYYDNWEWLDNNNLKLVQLQQAENRVMGYDDDPRSDRNMKLLRIKGLDNGDLLPIYQFDREADVEPGLYRVEMLYRIFDNKSALVRVTVPGSEKALTDTLSYESKRNKFSDYSWEEAANRPALSKKVEKEDWTAVQANADSLDWHYYSYDFAVKQPGKAVVSLLQDADFCQSPKASSHLNFANIRILKISSDKVK